MRLGLSVLLYLVVLEPSLSLTEEEAETLSPYSVIDYRIPLKHQQLLAVVNPEAAMRFYLGKLNIDYPMDDLESVRQTLRHEKWNLEFLTEKTLVQDMYSCELKRQRLGQSKFFYYDEVTDFGKTACFNQCLSENGQYYTYFLSGKLQEFIYKNPLLDVALYAPRSFSGEVKISQCRRLAKKVYRCECSYKHYLIKVSPEFERLFGKILLETREATAGVADPEELETKYGVPMKLMGFLIVYHLMPDQMFLYLLWWTNTEMPDDDVSEQVTPLA